MSESCAGPGEVGSNPAARIERSKIFDRPVEAAMSPPRFADAQPGATDRPDRKPYPPHGWIASGIAKIYSSSPSMAAPGYYSVSVSRPGRIGVA